MPEAVFTYFGPTTTEKTITMTIPKRTAILCCDVTWKNNSIFVFLFLLFGRGTYKKSFLHEY